MMHVHHRTLLLFVVVWCVASAVDTGEDGDDDDVSVDTAEEQDRGMRIKFAGSEQADNLFKPTKYWQTVPPGQPIPKGLHIRYNLQTGKTEAKLLDETDAQTDAGAHRDALSTGTSLSHVESVEDDGDDGENDDSSALSRQKMMRDIMQKAMNDLEAQGKGSEEDSVMWQDGDRVGMMNLQGKSFSGDELKDALKKFKANQDDVTNAEAKAAEVRGKFRSYAELKKHMSEMEVNVKTESEILYDLIQRYQNPSVTEDEKLTILTDLEYYLHQIDNAYNFVMMGGMDMVSRDLNSTSESVRNEVAIVMGAAMQSNPAVQRQSLLSGILTQLIRMLAADPSDNLRGRVLYAASTLIRDFPLAQEKFLEHGGFSALTQILHSPHAPEKLKIKAVTLVNDLLTEQINVLENPEAHEDGKMNIYKNLSTRVYLREQGWCRLVPELLSSAKYDAQEKVLAAMATLLPDCSGEFQLHKHAAMLRQLQRHYSTQAHIEIQDQDDDEYFRNLLKNVEELINLLAVKEEL